MSGPLPIALYVLDFLGYGVFAAVLVMRNLRRPISLLMALAATLTAFWALSELGAGYEFSPTWCAHLTSVLKDGAWFAFILAMMDRSSRSLTAWRFLVAISAGIMLFHAVLTTSNITLG